MWVKKSGRWEGVFKGGGKEEQRTACVEKEREERC